MTSRRVFIKQGAFALVSLGFAPSFLARTAMAAGGRAKQLIAIFQRGAVDGLNMIVPYGEGEYYKVRPSIAIARPGAGPDGAIDLDGFFAFNPRMAPLEPFWDRRDLAVVHACGSPDATRSHFDAQDYMETATPGVKSTQDGWRTGTFRRGTTTRRRRSVPWPCPSNCRGCSRVRRPRWPSIRSRTSAYAEAWDSPSRRSTRRPPIGC